jgi:hypothetical protein
LPINERSSLAPLGGCMTKTAATLASLMVTPTPSTWIPRTSTLVELETD